MPEGRSTAAARTTFPFELLQGLHLISHMCRVCSSGKNQCVTAPGHHAAPAWLCRVIHTVAVFLLKHLPALSKSNCATGWQQKVARGRVIVNKSNHQVEPTLHKLSERFALEVNCYECPYRYCESQSAEPFPFHSLRSSWLEHLSTKVPEALRILAATLAKDCAYRSLGTADTVQTAWALAHLFKVWQTA